MIRPNWSYIHTSQDIRLVHSPRSTETYSWVLAVDGGLSTVDVSDFSMRTAQNLSSGCFEMGSHASTVAWFTTAAPRRLPQ